MSAELNLLGGFDLLIDARSAAPAARKVKALAAYLACQAGKPVARDVLAALLWPDSEETQARQSVRQALTALRRALGDLADVLEADNERVLLKLDSIKFDVAGFEQACADDDPELAADLYRGELLEGFSARVPGFDDWLGSERERLAQQARAALRRAIAAQIETDTEQALRLARRLLRLDPLDEFGHRAAMQALANGQRRAEALKQHATCKRVLATQLGVEPAAETQLLFEKIRASKAPAAPSESADASDPSATAELRHVVLVAACSARPDVPDDPETHLALSKRWQALITQTWARYGGLVQSADEDTIWAGFGLDVARGDELARAVKAQLALRAALADEHAGTGLSVVSGQVLVSSDGSAEIELSGAVISAARELARLAPAGQIAMPAELAASVQAVGRLETLGGHQQVCVLEHAQLDGPNQHRLVGRHLEKQQVLAALTACRESQYGATVMIRGEAGIGKSSLIGQVASEAADAGFAVATVHLLDFGASRTPLARMAGALLDIGPDEQAGSFTGQRLAGMGLVDDDLAVLLNALALDMPPELADYWNDLDAPSIARLRRQAIARLIQHGTQLSPLLLVVEDVHWADEELLATLANLAALTADHPLVLLLSTRLEGQPLDPAWRAAMQDSALMTLDLGPLRAADSALLAGQLSQDSNHVSRCVAQAQGHPFILEQLLRCGASGGLPSSLSGLVQARLDQLSPEDREAAQVASVLGHVFELRHLTRLLGRDDFASQALLEQRFFRSVDGGIGFAHALLREATYATLLKSRRDLLHRRAADLFADSDRWRQAQHLIAAGSAEAVPLCVELGEQERRDHRLAGALELAKAGLDLATESGDRYQLALIAGECYRVLGNLADAVSCYQQAAANAASKAEAARAALGHAITLGDEERHQAAFDLLDPIYQRMEEMPPRFKSDVANARGRQLFALGRARKAYASQQAAQEFALAAGSTLREARARYGLAEICYARGELIAAVEHYRRVGVLCETHRFEPALHATNLAMSGLSRVFLMEVNSGVEQIERAIEINREIGYERAAGFVNVCAGLAQLVRADYPAAIAHGERARREAARQGRVRYQAAALNIVGLGHMMSGNPALALKNARECLNMAAMEHLPFVGPTALVVLAALAENNQARDEFCTQAETIFSFAGISHCHYLYRFYATMMFADAGDFDAAAAQVARLSEYAGDLPFATQLAAALGVRIDDRADAWQAPEGFGAINSITRPSSVARRSGSAGA